MSPTIKKKCESLNNQQYITERTPMNLHLNKYTRTLGYYPLTVNLDRCKGES